MALLVTGGVTLRSESLITFTNQADTNQWYQGTIQTMDFQGMSEAQVWMAGFGLVFAAGVTGIGVRWVRRIIGGGGESE